METSGAVPRGAVDAPELAEIIRKKGPFLTAYVTTDAEIENASQQSQAHWKALRAELESAGAPSSVLDEVDGLVPDAHLEGQCLAVVADADGVVHVEHEPDVPHHDLGRWAALPSLVPLLEWRQRNPAHVVVLADRTGADLFAFRRAQPDLHREAGGADGPIRKVQPGGWSQRRFQQRAENMWEQNAEDVAKELVRLVERVDARVVAVAGDVRAVQLLKDSLPPEVAAILTEIDGSRSVDGSIDEVASDVVRVVDTAVAADTKELLQKYKEELGQSDRACNGPAATLAALAAAQVAVLLVHDDPDDDRTAWFGEEPNMVGTTDAEVRAFGAQEPQQGRLVDVAVRAALGTGAGVRVVPSAGGPKDGVGGILRWS